jgi:hypothetical protein
VFVFAITQVSHLLLAHLSWERAGQAALVLLPGAQLLVRAREQVTGAGDLLPIGGAP